MRRIAQQYRPLLNPLAIFTSYLVWVWLFRLLILSFITYFLLGSVAGRPPRFEEISDVLGANELPLIGVSAFLFVAFLKVLHPLTSTTTGEIISFARCKKNFLPGALHGLIFSISIVLAFILSGLYRVFGFSIQADEFALALPGLILRICTMIIFVYCEEFIFRRKIMDKWVRAGNSQPGSLPWVPILGTACLYCLTKLVQFDIGIMQTLTLFLISIVLSLRSLADGDFGRGAGFWALILIVFQPFFGLPVLGSEFSGILLLKYQSTSLDSTAKFLTGGNGGPLAGFAFQFLLLVDMARSIPKLKDLIQPTRNR